MSFSVKGTATLQNDKVSLVLRPDAQDIRPDTDADDSHFDVRAAMLKKIVDGLMPVHPSRSPLSSRDLLVHICHAQTKQQLAKQGMCGQRNPSAEAVLATALLKPKRLQNDTPSSSSAPLALENGNIPAASIQSSPKNTSPNDAKADASSSSSSSSSTEDELEQTEEEQEETKDEQEQDTTAEEQQKPIMPDYAQWTSEWHDVYTQLLLIYESSELNAKRCKIMDTLLTDLRKAKGQFDAAE